MDNIAKLEKQVILLGNNNKVLDLTRNYLEQQKIEIEELKKIIISVEEKNSYALRACQIAEEGYKEIEKDILSIITTD